MAAVVHVRCVLCGCDRKRPAAFGLVADGSYSPAEAHRFALSQRVSYIGGHANLRVERQALPLPLALGMRDALKDALARVDAELAEAGVVVDDGAEGG